MDKINFTGSTPHPGTRYSWEFLQNVVKQVSALGFVAGRNLILQGCTEAGGVVADGLVLCTINGIPEVLPLKGGIKTDYVYIVEVNEDQEALGVTYSDVFTKRHLEFGGSLSDIAWSSFYLVQNSSLDNLRYWVENHSARLSVLESQFEWGEFDDGQFQANWSNVTGMEYLNYHLNKQTNVITIKGVVRVANTHSATETKIIDLPDLAKFNPRAGRKILGQLTSYDQPLSIITPQTIPFPKATANYVSGMTITFDTDSDLHGDNQYVHNLSYVSTPFPNVNVMNGVSINDMFCYINADGQMYISNRGVTRVFTHAYYYGVWFEYKNNI